MIRPISAFVTPQSGATASGRSPAEIPLSGSDAVRALGDPSARKAWIAALRRSLDAVDVFPPPVSFDIATRRQTMPVRAQSYSSSCETARRLFGYDDAQLSMAAGLVQDRFAMRAPEPMYAGDPCEGRLVDSPLAHFFGTQPYRAMFVLLADTGLGLTSADLRVVGFYDTCDGRLQSFALPFLMVAPGCARYFDHERDDRGRTLDTLSDFIHARREQVFLIDACAERPARLVRFAQTRSMQDIRDQLMTLCQRVSAKFATSASAQTARTVIVSSRESSCAYVGEDLRFPSLAETRKLHLSFDITRGPIGDGENAAAVQGNNACSKNTIALSGFGDLGFPPAVSSLPRLPNAYRTIQQELRDAIPPFADALARALAQPCRDRSAEHLAASHASEAPTAGKAGAYAMPSSESVLYTFEALIRDTPRLLEQAASIGTVDSLRIARETLGRLKTCFQGSEARPLAMVEPLSLAYSRLDDADKAIRAIERMETADTHGVSRALIMRSRRQEIRVLTQACQEIFASPARMPDEPSGGAPAMDALVSCLIALAGQRYAETVPVPERPSEQQINDIERHLDIVRELPNSCSRGAVQRALRSIDAVMTHVTAMPMKEDARRDIETPARKIRGTLSVTLGRLDRIALVAEEAWRVLEDAGAGRARDSSMVRDDRA